MACPQVVRPILSIYANCSIWIGILRYASDHSASTAIAYPALESQSPIRTRLHKAITCRAAVTSERDKKFILATASRDGVDCYCDPRFSLFSTFSYERMARKSYPDYVSRRHDPPPVALLAIVLERRNFISSFYYPQLRGIIRTGLGVTGGHYISPGANINSQAYTLFAPPRLFYAFHLASLGRIACHRYLVAPCVQKTAEC